MQRGDKSRFCGDCKKSVHDLAAMTKLEASTFLAKTANEELCVRYLHDAMGHMVFVDTFRDRPIPLVALLRKRASQAVAVAALGMSLTACMGIARTPPPVDPTKPAHVWPTPASSPDAGTTPITTTTDPAATTNNPAATATDPTATATDPAATATDPAHKNTTATDASSTSLPR